MKKEKKISRFTNILVVFWGFAIFLNGIVFVTAIATAMIEAIVLFGIIEALFVWRFVVNMKRYRSPEYRQMQVEARAYFTPEQKTQRKEKAALAKAEMEKEFRPVSAVLISTQNVTGKSVLGTAARGVVGGAVGGVFGAAVGITTAKTKVKDQKAVFSVKYESGRIGTEAVKIGSARFMELTAVMTDKHI